MGAYRSLMKSSIADSGSSLSPLGPNIRYVHGQTPGAPSCPPSAPGRSPGASRGREAIPPAGVEAPHRHHHANWALEQTGLGARVRQGAARDGDRATRRTERRASLGTGRLGASLPRTRPRRARFLRSPTGTGLTRDRAACAAAAAACTSLQPQAPAAARVVEPDGSGRRLPRA